MVIGYVQHSTRFLCPSLYSSLYGPTKCFRDVLKVAQIGRLNRGDDADDYDQIQIVGPEYIHPLYEVNIRNNCYFLRNQILFLGISSLLNVCFYNLLCVSCPLLKHPIIIRNIL